MAVDRTGRRLEACEQSNLAAVRVACRELAPDLGDEADVRMPVRNPEKMPLTRLRSERGARSAGLEDFPLALRSVAAGAGFAFVTSEPCANALPAVCPNWRGNWARFGVRSGCLRPERDHRNSGVAADFSGVTSLLRPPAPARVLWRHAASPRRSPNGGDGGHAHRLPTNMSAQPAASLRLTKSDRIKRATGDTAHPHARPPNRLSVR